MFKATIVIAMIVSLCALSILLNVTTPATIGPFGILMIFVFSYTSLLCAMTFFVFFVTRYFARLVVSIVPKTPIKALSIKESYYYSTVFAMVPIMLVGLQSVGAVSFYEVSLVILFAILGCVYVAKRL